MSIGKKCYLCGSKLANTKDHLFPRGLFNNPLPTNLPTLPACSECNNALHKAEVQFRFFLASGMAYDQEPGFRIWKERIIPSFKAGKFKSLIMSHMKKAQLLSESGELLGHTLVQEIDREIINSVLRKIANGLYYLDTGAVLPENVQILIYYANGKPERFTDPPLDEAIKHAKKVELGNGVVTYWRNTIKDDPASSITWLKFYEDKVFMICTYTADGKEKWSIDRQDGIEE